MATKNTESTAVNQLIELVSTQKPLAPDPDEDLMFKPVKPGKRNTVSAPRMTSTVPPIHGAGEVEPLPRMRAPVGTQQGLPTVDAAMTIRAQPPQVRVTTAPPNRVVTIPPVAPPLTLDDYPDGDDAEVTTPGPQARATSHGVPAAPRMTMQGAAAVAPPPTPRSTSIPPPRPSADMPAQPAQRTSAPRTTLPPPRPSANMPAQRGSAPPAPRSNPDIQSRPTKPTFPPPQLPAYPVVRPSSNPTTDFHYPPSEPSLPPIPSTRTAMPPAIAPDFVAPLAEPSSSGLSSSWSVNVETQQVPKNGLRAIAGKLIAPMVIMVVAGIFIGGYFAFDGDGGKKRDASADSKAAAEPKAATAAQADVKAEPAKADAAKADVKAEPADVKAEPAKAQEPAKAEPAMADTKADVKADLAKADVAKADVKAEPAKAEMTADVKADRAKADVAKADVAKADVKAEPAKKSDVKAGLATDVKADSAKADLAKAADAKSQPITPPNLAASTAPSKTEPAKAPALATTAKPALVDVRIDSSPSGATVTLIDRGKSTYLGTTPMSAAVDSARKYELVFSYENRATVVEALDPAKTTKVSVRLSRGNGRSSSSSSSGSSGSSGSSSSRGEVPKTSKLATPTFDTAKAEGSKSEASKSETAKKVEAPKSEAAKSESSAKAEPAKSESSAKAEAAKSESSAKAEAPKTEKDAKREALKAELAKSDAAAKSETAAGGDAKKSDAKGEGTLMISSKPPCEILIDGKSTGLTTPQRAIGLPAGMHKITLVNTVDGIKKTVSVQITADKPTKVIQDFMK